MQRVRIYRPAKNVMQSGRANTRDWLLEFETDSVQRPDSLMGWAGQGDTRRQVWLRFETREEAVAYAEKHGLEYEVEAPRARKIRHKSYSDNFRFGRDGNWTH